MSESARHEAEHADSREDAHRVHPALPILAAAATGVQVGAALVASRFVVEQTGPATLALLRYAIGALCLLPALLVSRRVRFSPRDLVPVAVLGIVQFGVLIALLNHGLRHIPAGRAGVIFATFPLLTMILAAALGIERLSRARTLGVLLTFGGVVVALRDRVGVPVGGAGWLGEAAVFASAACGAVCSVLYRPYLRRYPTVQVGWVAMVASVVFLALLATPESPHVTVPAIDAKGWAAILFIGASSGIGYWLWLWAFKYAPPTRVAVFLALSPITAGLLGTLLLGEALSGALLAGIALVVAGLVVAHARAG